MNAGVLSFSIVNTHFFPLFEIRNNYEVGGPEAQEDFQMFLKIGKANQEKGL